MDEVLVHVSAPSTASDDARYRAQVAAIRVYLLTTNGQQRPSSERQVSASECVPSQDAEGPAEGNREELPSLRSSSLVNNTDIQWGPDSPLRAFETSNNEAENDDDPVHDPQPNSMIPALPSLETKSIASALLAPNDRPRQGCGGGTEHDSLESLVSVIPDSQPELVSLSVQEGSDSALFLQRVRDASPPRRRHEDDPADSVHSPSSKRRRMEKDGSSTSEATSSSLCPADQVKNNHQKAIPIPTPNTSTTTTATATSTTTTTTTSQSPLTLLKNTPLQIRPPPPPISTIPFTTHKTPTLTMLEQRLNPSRTYKPTRQTRELDKLERGYWAVQITIGQLNDHEEPDRSGQPGLWTPALFSRFWGFLGEFIGREGRAGWGVWCFLDRSTDDAAAAAAAGASEQAQDQPGPDSEAVSVLLKVYTWGEIAMHVYLVLFLASERKIRGLGVQWRDSRDEVVIQMH